MILWHNIDFAKRIYAARIGTAYDYGGSWDQYDATQGTDCSGCVSAIIEACVNGPARMKWNRQFSTETWRPYSMGGNADPNHGPYGCMMVNSPNDFPPDAALKIAVMHGPGGGQNSHMVCQSFDGFSMETGGGDITQPFQDATPITDSEFNCFWYLPGPVDNPLTEAGNTLFADVSYFQAPVNDQYPYRVLSIRSNDGTFVDPNFGHNYKWLVNNLNRNWLDLGLVYCYCRPDWQGTVNTMTSLINQNGGLHPQVALMMDIESGNRNGSADARSWLDPTYNALTKFTGNPARVIAYGNAGDLTSMWSSRLPTLKVILASYGSNPSFPNKIAHQYTDGQGHGGGLPEGATPFGTCDLNSADGLNPIQFAQACGVSTAPTSAPPPPPSPEPYVPDWDLILRQFAC